MNADTAAARHRPRPVESRDSIQMRYLLDASQLSPQAALQLLTGINTFSQDVTRGYEHNGFGGHVTRTRDHRDRVTYVRRLDGTRPLQEYGYRVPFGISGDGVDEQQIGRTQFYQRYGETRGHRIRKIRHQLFVPGEIGLRVARVDVYQRGRPGEVGRQGEIAGRTLVSIDFGSVRQAQAFHDIRPPYLRTQATAYISDRKLVQQLARETDKDLAIGMLQESASLADLRKRATMIPRSIEINPIIQSLTQQ